MAGPPRRRSCCVRLLSLDYLLECPHTSRVRGREGERLTVSTSGAKRVSLSPSSTTTLSRSDLGIVGQEASLEGRVRSQRQDREPRDSGGGAERRALTLASTRPRCWSDDAASTTTYCGRRNSRIPRILELANTRLSWRASTRRTLWGETGFAAGPDAGRPGAFPISRSSV